MKLRILLAIFVMAAFCTGCAIFRDNFEADPLGPPLVSPPGAPSGDSLNLIGPAGSITVINSVPHGSKAVKIDRPPSSPGALECVTASGAHSSGKYSVEYKAYSVYVSTIPTLTTTVKSAGGQRAYELKLSDGKYQLLSGSGTVTLPGGYAANVVHSISISIDMDANRFSVEIDGASVASNEQFLDPGFNDVHLLRFEYTPPITEALGGSYVVDDIVIK